MRTIWKGSLSFGLVTIPVRLFPAVKEKSVSFNQLRGSDHSRIGYKRVSKTDGEEVEYDDIVRGYEYTPDRYVVFTGDEIDALKPASSHAIDIVQFTPLSQIDPVYFQRSYYLAPEPAGAKAYGLLAGAMRDRETVAICKITLRDKEHLATVRLHGELFVLETMYWPDEIIELGLSDVDVDEVPEPRPQEVAMAEMLIESLTADFEPEAFKDEYRERLLAAVQAKVEGEEVVVAEETGEPAAVVDLMAALKASVEASKGQGQGNKGRSKAEAS